MFLLPLDPPVHYIPVIRSLHHKHVRYYSTCDRQRFVGPYTKLPTSRQSDSGIQYQRPARRHWRPQQLLQPSTKHRLIQVSSAGRIGGARGSPQTRQQHHRHRRPYHRVPCCLTDTLAPSTLTALGGRVRNTKTTTDHITHTHTPPPQAYGVPIPEPRTNPVHSCNTHNTPRPVPFLGGQGEAEAGKRRCLSIGGTESSTPLPVLDTARR